ncbi:MAG: N-acetylneuraminate synthase family protein [Thermoplasmatota archaeon]
MILRFVDRKKYPSNRPFIIAEIGINHNGDLKIAKKLIDGAVQADADAVKFQKRTIDEVYDEEYLNSFRESPFGTTQREQKEALEFGLEEYQEIDKYCKEVGIEWFASAWDLKSQLFLQQFDLNYNKIASPMLTNEDLLEMVANEGKYTFISTGMSTMPEIARAVDIFRYYECPFELMHCNSTYPLPKEDANLRVIQTLEDAFHCNVGYSGHEQDFVISLGAVARGATSLERHITLDRSMYGSDQSASIVIDTLRDLVSYCRTLYPALGNGVKRVTDSEKPIREKLRGE